MCDKNSKFTTLARSKLNEAPKDIKVLEVLRPPNAPTMKERYEMAIAKERRLESVSQPEVSQAAKEKAKKETVTRETQKEDRILSVDDIKKKTKKLKLELNEDDLKNVESLKEADKVQEGIDWSDSEDDGSNEEM